MNITLILLSIFLVSVFLGAFFDAPWWPTRKKDFDRIAELAKLQRGMLLYELGSGTGNTLFYLSNKYGISCVGIEISPILYLYSKIKSLFYKNVEIRYGDFYKYDLSNADVVYIFLISKVFNKVKEKVSRELKENTKIIVSCWPLKSSSPIEISKKNDNITYYLYNKKSILA